MDCGMPGFPVHQYLPGFAVTISIFSHLFAVRDGTGCHDLIFLKIELKPSFTLYSFNFMKRNFSSYSLSTMRVVSSAYLRLFIFLLAILISACESSSPAFHMMYSTHKLNKQGDNIQSWCIPFPILNQSLLCGSNCCCLSVSYYYNSHLLSFYLYVNFFFLNLHFLTCSSNKPVLLGCGS